MKHSYFNKAKADADHQTDSAPFFIEKGVLSAGWSFKDTPEMRAEAIEKIQTFSDYRKFFDETSNKLGWNKKWNNQSVHYLFDNLQAGDFVWLKNKGTYWVTQVPQDPKSMFKFNMSEQFMAADAVAHIGPLEWIEVGGLVVSRLPKVVYKRRCNELITGMNQLILMMMSTQRQA